MVVLLVVAEGGVFVGWGLWDLGVQPMCISGTVAMCRREEDGLVEKGILCRLMGISRAR